jgi:4-hydroxy-2-oxoheptanedioate aldolase
MKATMNGALSHPNGGSLLGLIVKMPAAATVEIAGHAGFDLVLIDTEHGPGEMIELEHHIRAAESAGIGVLVRVGDVHSPDILRALDAGADGVVVPHVTSGDDVRKAASLTRYPPDGRRSLAISTRAGRYGTGTVAEHLKSARQHVALVAQLEDADALANTHEILAADGLAGVFIGPSDLSASLGHPGEIEHPRVAEAIEQIANAVLQHARLALCVLVADENEACHWIERGARIVLMNAPALLAERLTTICRVVKNREASTSTVSW